MFSAPFTMDDGPYGLPDCSQTGDCGEEIYEIPPNYHGIIPNGLAGATGVEASILIIAFVTIVALVTAKWINMVT